MAREVSVKLKRESTTADQTKLVKLIRRLNLKVTGNQSWKIVTLKGSSENANQLQAEIDATGYKILFIH